MIILIGLGNPGKKYASSRHNAGKMLAAWLKDEGRRTKDEGRRMLGKFEIMETDCYMNQSGEWIANRIQNSEFIIQNLFIAHDDLDLPLSSFKIQFATGPRLHKGLLSIEQALGTKDFWRVRIGVENRAKDQGLRAKGEEYVLRPFRREEKAILIKTFNLIRLALADHVTKSVRSDTFSD